MTTRSLSTESRPLTENEVTASVTLHEVKPGMIIPESVLRELLPDVDTALFFGKAFDLDYTQVSYLLYVLFGHIDVVEALLGESTEHSSELQSYVIDIVPDHIQAQHGTGRYTDTSPPPDTELLAQAFEAAAVTVAKSIKDVATKLGRVLGTMTNKYGQMTFQHLHKLNVQRNAIGTYDPVIVHHATPDRLVVLDVSGSMTATTVRRIVDEVVGLAYAVNAAMAIVSNNAFFWEAGTFTVDDVLGAAEYGGTHYEQLTPIFDRDWDTVVTIADYDSAWTARDHIAHHAKGRVREVLDISLVNRTTFLAECVGMIADEVRPLLIGTSSRVLSR